jgi:hypothetical protein
MRGKSFWYLYDFGDAWQHSVRIEGILPADLQATLTIHEPGELEIR